MITIYEKHTTGKQPLWTTANHIITQRMAYTGFI